MYGNVCNMEYVIMILRISVIEYNNIYRYFFF